MHPHGGSLSGAVFEIVRFFGISLDVLFVPDIMFSPPFMIIGYSIYLTTRLYIPLIAIVVLLYIKLCDDQSDCEYMDINAHTT